MSARPPIRRPWERVIRVPTATPERVVVERARPPRPPTRAPLLLAFGFAATILVGSILLSLPVANREGTITPPVTALFTATSAFGIVGLSTGITPDLSLPGKLLITVTMFLGRVGPLTVALALAQQERPAMFRYPEGRVRIG